MKQALLTSDVVESTNPEKKRGKAARKERRLRRKFQKKTFNELTAEERDELLKNMAIVLGFIKDDPE